ncbi:MAG: hypothetical protein RMJ37_02315 [Spirochaetia bacterium]|nr:hypothetical protein [Spirochaetota bacterium]MCX8096733.1 hypothetical protein [Spirochaetota bacterium]MDW8112160.1 hypothetical protein [Spirochaetia bacterium]
MKLLVLISGITLSSIVINGCVIGAIYQSFPLTPPLGLELVQKSTNQIEARWWGNNSENYFSGYVIFISTNSNDIYKDRNSTNHFDKPYLNNSSGGLPTVIAPISIITRDFSFTITSLPNGSNITTNITYYVGVASYSASRRTFSPLSNITNITLTN